MRSFVAREAAGAEDGAKKKRRGLSPGTGGKRQDSEAAGIGTARREPWWLDAGSWLSTGEVDVCGLRFAGPDAGGPLGLSTAAQIPSAKTRLNVTLFRDAGRSVYASRDLSTRATPHLAALDFG